MKPVGIYSTDLHYIRSITVANFIGVVLALAFTWQVSAATPAGTNIVNTATASFQIEQSPGLVKSNSVTSRLDEVLNLTLVAKTAGPVSIPTSGSTSIGRPFVLTNTGNGNEAFHVEATAPAQADALTVATDVDGNGAYDPAVDTTLPHDGITPVLVPGASLNLLLVFREPPSPSGTATIKARALTGSGTPGTVFTDAGDGGSDALVGQTRAEASLPIAYAPADQAGSPAKLEKSQSVRAPDGSATPISGAVVTYRLALTTSATGALSDAEIVDSIPAGTAYVPGSIRIEDAAASDVSDADAAYFDGQTIHIALGEISQPTTRVVTFQVTIL